jgi:hypothetical protein
MSIFDRSGLSLVAQGLRRAQGLPVLPGIMASQVRVRVSIILIEGFFSNKHEYDSYVCLVTGASSESGAVCLPCPAGTFAQYHGSTQTACVACPIGSYSPSEGAENCLSCSSDNSCSSKKCPGRCNFVKIRANPDSESGGYLCKYSKKPDAPEYPCILPEFTSEVKTSCDFENSLLCKYRASLDSRSMQLECWVPA